MLNAPSDRRLWDFLAPDPELNEMFWTRTGGWQVPRDDIERAVTELLARGRSWVAVDILSTGLLGADPEELGIITPDGAEAVLEAALEGDPGESRVQSLGYEIGLVLDYLERAGSSSGVLARYEFFFFRFFDNHRTPRALFTELARDPAFFVDLVRRVYRGTDEPPADLDEADQAMGSHAWWVLNHWNDIPGRQPDGTLDGAHLDRWVRAGRLAFTDINRADIGDEQIGQVLAASPPGADGVWPAEPVREII